MRGGSYEEKCRGVTFALLVAVACSSSLLTTEPVPGWLSTKIREFDRMGSNAPAFVARYDYQGQVVYYVPARCCDIPSVLYDTAGTLQGDLSGGFSAEYFDIQQRGSGVIHMLAHHTITRSTGTIRTSDEILLLPDQDPAVGRPNSRLDVIGGTGAYDGATGVLHTHGQLNLATLAGSLQYRGEVCVP